MKLPATGFMSYPQISQKGYTLGASLLTEMSVDTKKAFLKSYPGFRGGERASQGQSQGVTLKMWCGLGREMGINFSLSVF